MSSLPKFVLTTLEDLVSISFLNVWQHVRRDDLIFQLWRATFHRDETHEDLSRFWNPPTSFWSQFAYQQYYGSSSQINAVAQVMFLATRRKNQCVTLYILAEKMAKGPDAQSVPWSEAASYQKLLTSLGSWLSNIFCINSSPFCLERWKLRSSNKPCFRVLSSMKLWSMARTCKRCSGGLLS